MAPNPLRHSLRNEAIARTDCSPWGRALLPYLSEEPSQRTPTRGEASGIAFFARRSATLGLVGLTGELDRPQPQLLLYLGVGCDFCESAASPCQFAEIARVRYRYLPNRSYSWIPEEGGLFPLHPYGGPRPGRRLTPAPPPLDRDDRLPPPPVPSGTGAAPFEVEDLCRGAEPGPE